MGTVPVVLMQPGIELGLALARVLIDAGVGPFPQRGLDEALGFAVGAGGVGASAQVANAETTAGSGEEAGVVAGGIVGEDTTDADAEAGVVGDGSAQEGHGGGSALIGEEAAESDTGMVVDGDVQHLPAGAAGFVAGIAGETVSGFGDTGQLFGVEMEEIAGMRVFVAAHGQGGLQVAGAAEAVTAQDTTDGGAAQAGGLGNAHAGPTLAAQPQDLLGGLAGDLTRGTVGTRGAIVQTRAALVLVASYPLARRLAADAERGGRRVPRQLLGKDSLG